MDRDQHRAWLAELAADNLRKRREVEPGLDRKEAVLREAREHLARSQAAVLELEAELHGRRPSAEHAEEG